MGTIEIIKRFIESNWAVEKITREFLERLPVRFRFGISYGPIFRYWLAFLKESEEWDRERIETFQFEQLRALLIHAGKNVPYYRRVFSEYGFNPEKIQEPKDIEILPLLDKETVRDNWQDLLSENIPRRRMIRTGTGGTTGIPVIIYTTKDAEEKHWATIVDLWSRIGYHPRSRVVSFYHNITYGKRNFMPYKKYANQLIISRNFFNRQWLVRFVEMIRRFRPEFVCGFPSHLTFFCNFMEETAEAPFNGIKAVLIYSEGIMHWQKKLIERYFGARVFVSYGMVEKVLYGGDCEHPDRGIHLYPQYGFVENRPVCEHNELIGTGFINYAMPLIRYRTMDAGTVTGHHCKECGRSYPIVPAVEGRLYDYVVDKHGNIVSIIGVGTRSDCFDNVKMYQFYQEEKGKVILRILRKPTYTDRDTWRIREELEKKLGIRDNLDVVIEFVEDIERTPAGKSRVIIQRIDLKEVLQRHAGSD